MFKMVPSLLFPSPYRPAEGRNGNILDLLKRGKRRREGRRGVMCRPLSRFARQSPASFPSLGYCASPSSPSPPHPPTLRALLDCNNWRQSASAPGRRSLTFCSHPIPKSSAEKAFCAQKHTWFERLFDIGGVERLYGEPRTPSTPTPSVIP